MTDVLIRSKESPAVEVVIDVENFDHGEFTPQKDGSLGTFKDAGYTIVHEHPSGLPYKAPVVHRATPAKAEGDKDK